MRTSPPLRAWLVAASLAGLWLATAQAVTPPPKVKPVATHVPAYQTFVAGTISRSDTLASLRQRLGKEQVQATQIPGSEEDVPGWIVYPHDPQRRIYIYLDDAGKHPDMAMVLDARSLWQRADGVHVGMSLGELVQRNGKMLDFSGFGWDEGGYVIDWHGGKLGVGLAVRLCEPDFPNGNQTTAYPGGEGSYSSTLPILRRYPPKVCEFALPTTPAERSR